MKLWLGIDACGAVANLKRSWSPSGVLDESCGDCGSTLARSL